MHIGDERHLRSTIIQDDCQTAINKR